MLKVLLKSFGLRKKNLTAVMTAVNGTRPTTSVTGVPLPRPSSAASNPEGLAGIARTPTPGAASHDLATDSRNKPLNAAARLKLGSSLQSVDRPRLSSTLPDPRVIDARAERGPPLVLPKRYPAGRRKRPLGVWWSLLAMVIIPTAAIALFYYRYAPDMYVAEFRFSVNSSVPILPGGSPIQASSGSSANSAVASMSTSMGAQMASTPDMTRNYMVADYLSSKKAIDDISTRLDLRKTLARGGADQCAKMNRDFGGFGNLVVGMVEGLFGPLTDQRPWCGRSTVDMQQEEFAEYWKSLVTCSYDPITGLATAQVKAFTPSDALAISKGLVTAAEELVNDIATRPNKDMVAFAKQELERAEERLKNDRAKMTDFRRTEGTIDPTLNGVNTNANLIAQVRSTMIQDQAALESMKRQGLTESAPMVAATIAKIRGSREQLAGLDREVREKQTRQSGSLTDVVDKFESLDLDRQYSRQSLINATQAYDQARANAAVQHVYLTPYVLPALPEKSTEPQRAFKVLLSFLMLFCVWMISLMFYRGVRDHQA